MVVLCFMRGYCCCGLCLGVGSCIVEGTEIKSLIFMRSFALFIVVFLVTLPAIVGAQDRGAVPVRNIAQDVTQEIRNFRNFRDLQIDHTARRPDVQNFASSQLSRNQAARQNRESPRAVSEREIMERISVDKLIRENAPSPLEAMYSSRIVQPLEQFGYDLFGVPHAETRAVLGSSSVASSSPSGAVQDDFILGAGDELEIVFTGQRRDRGVYTINNRGLLIVPDLPPIPASGRSIGQLRVSIEAAARNLHNTEAYVSLSSVRQIGALVIGHVKRPGRKNLTVFHTVLDALMESGGIEKTGSLRQIKLIREGRSTILDLYALLMHGQSTVDLRLRDGDRIIVPAIGPTVAVAGEAKRPGIFEILTTRRGMLHEPAKNSEKLTLNEMLELGGGVLAPGRNRHLQLGITAAGAEEIAEINDAFVPAFGDGSILMVSKGLEKRSGTVELRGNTRRPGLHALAENKNLSDLLSSDSVLGPQTYPLLGVIERFDADQLTDVLMDFPLRLVLKGDFDRALRDGDVIHLFSHAQIAGLGKAGDDLPPAEIGSAAGVDGDVLDDPVLRSFLRERAAFMRGAVRSPGHYPVAQGVTLDSLLAVAGGLALEANISNIEVTSSHLTQGAGKHRERIDLTETRPENIVIEPGASVRINQKFEKIRDQSVLIIGEVGNPGRYDLLPGDKVSDLLRRAGGMTRDAYPYGAIFSREAERRAQESRFKAQSRAIRQEIAAALETESKDVNAGKIAEARALADELDAAQGVGRITVEADPGSLAVHPELDLLLEAGDRIFIPKRGLTVRVHGEVLSAASLQFREGKSPLDYIHEAGGFTYHADKDRTFVLYPDGSAQPLQVSAWNYKSRFIPPGSTIVVPRDPKPFDFIQSTKDISQILSNLAVTAIFIDDVIEE